MEPTMQNNQNDAKNTLWITVGSIIILVLLVWGGIYMYQNREVTDVGENNDASTATTTRRDLGEDDREVTATERTTVDAYLRARINDLSPRKPAAGRAFTVTTVITEAAGRAIVEYTDKVSIYTAAVSYKIDASGNIVVTNFDILEK